MMAPNFTTKYLKIVIGPLELELAHTTLTSFYNNNLPAHMRGAILSQRVCICFIYFAGFLNKMLLDFYFIISIVVHFAVKRNNLWETIRKYSQGIITLNIITLRGNFAQTKKIISKLTYEHNETYFVS